jgi:hypothetical protein
MASIALTSIGCIIYLAQGTVLTRAMFRQRQRERKLDVFFSPKKAQDVHWEVRWCMVLTTPRQTSWAFLAGKKHQVFSPAATDKTLHALKLLLKLGK